MTWSNTALRVALCLGAGWLVGGCGTTEREKRAQVLYYRSPAIAIERVSSEGLVAFAEATRATSERSPAAIGTRYCAQVVSTPLGDRHIDSVQLLDTASDSPIGEVHGISLPESELGDRHINLTWNRKGDALLIASRVWFHSFWTEIGVVRPPSLSFRRLMRVDMPMGTAAWADGVVIVGYCSDRNVLVEIDPLTGDSRTIWSRPRSSSDEGWPDHLAVSPDGRYIAFDLIGFPIKEPWEGGLWVVDRSSGAGTEVTYERPRGYEHYLIAWESETSLLFWRCIPMGQDELCRVRLATHVAGDGG